MWIHYPTSILNNQNFEIYIKQVQLEPFLTSCESNQSILSTIKACCPPFIDWTKSFRCYATLGRWVLVIYGFNIATKIQLFVLFNESSIKPNKMVTFIINTERIIQ